MIRAGSVAIGPTSVNADDFHDRVSLRSIAPFLSAKEAGLGNNALISYTASADATATYVCINGGGNHPKATNKGTVSGLVSASGTFSSVCAKKR
jgi:hypothetical protein